MTQSPSESPRFLLHEITRGGGAPSRPRRAGRLAGWRDRAARAAPATGHRFPDRRARDPRRSARSASEHRRARDPHVSDWLVTSPLPIWWNDLTVDRALLRRAA